MLWPQGLTGRFAALLIAGLIVLMLVGVAIYMHDRYRNPVHLFDANMATQVVSAVEFLEATPMRRQRNAAHSLSDRRLKVRVWRQRMDMDGPRGMRPPWLTQDPPWQVDDEALMASLREGLAPLEPRRIYVRLSQGLPGFPEPGPPDRWHDHLPSLTIGVRLQSGGWALFRLHQPAPPLRFGPLFWFGITIVLVILASVWAVHRMTQPLRRMAGAADRLGLDGDTLPLPERGPREMRNATRAFNRMQDRIRRLVDDRTLMLAAVSHDLRTVLTRLRLRAEYIDDDEQQAKAVADLDEMQAMLDATLAFARDDATDETIARLDLAAMLQSMVDDLADAGHQAAYDGPDRLSFSGRTVALRRAFANLIENALRYGECADVTLSPAAGHVVITVADRGPGIPADMRERVFDPFFRLETSRNRETGGTGLGLAVVRAIVGRHGGDVELEDRPGGGLLVRVTLPVSATA